jgi:chromosome segregation ATPase
LQQAESGRRAAGPRADLEECRRFIAELIDGAEQANTWLNDMHSQALSAEQTRDLYAEQISDLVEAIDIDHARIAKLEAELKKARQGAPKSAASDAVLRKLGDLSREVRAIRADLERLAKGIEPPRRGRSRSKKTTPTSSTISKHFQELRKLGRAGGHEAGRLTDGPTWSRARPSRSWWLRPGATASRSWPCMTLPPRRSRPRLGPPGPACVCPPPS